MTIVIAVGATAAPAEERAAADLRRYLYHLTGDVAQISRNTTGATFVLGTRDSNPALAQIAGPTAAESYLIQTIGNRILVLGADPQGVRYGVYRLLETYGVRFYLGRDVLPARRPFTLPTVDIEEQPAVARRGLLPWHDFLCGPSGYSFPDFRRYVDQLVKMRMNLLVLHNYAGGYPGRDINEPFMSFTYHDVGYDGYLDSSVDNERWGLAPTRASDMAFRAGDLMPHEVMASDAARATREQPDRRAHTFANGKTLMRQIIAYAQANGVEVALGTDFDLVPLPLAEAGCDPLDETTLAARIDDVVATYPTLAYLQLFYSESHRVSTEQAIKAYRFVHGYLAKVAPETRLVTGSWFQEERFGAMADALPRDVILSSLLPHDMRVKPDWAALAATGREAWAVPWIEIDGGLSEPQLAVRRMSERLPRLRAAGVSGVIGILWREQAVEANVAYLAADAWQRPHETIDPREFYADYTNTVLGVDAAVLFERIERAGVYGLPTTTNQFPGLPDPAGQTTPEFGTWFFSGSPAAADRARKWASLRAALAALPVHDPTAGHELTYWLATMEWMHRYWQAHGTVPAAERHADPAAAWHALAESGFREAITAYQDTVRDLTALGGLVSAAGGRWYYAGPPPHPKRVNEQFRTFATRIRERLSVPPPEMLRVRGTPTGAELTWTPVAGVAGYHVYRGPTRLTSVPVNEIHFIDKTSGRVSYRVTSVAADGTESPPSMMDSVRAGASAQGRAQVVLFPTPGTAVAGEPFDVMAIVRSDQADEFLGATLHYRRFGASAWLSTRMRRNVVGSGRAFHAAIPGSEVRPDGVEWFVRADDGGTAPPGAPGVTLSVVTTARTHAPGPAIGLRARADADGVLLEWRPAAGAVELYRIYRGATPDPATYLTYVPATHPVFRDAGSAGGTYAVVAVTLAGVSGPPASVTTA